MPFGIIWDLDGTLYDFYRPSKRALYVTWESAYFSGWVDARQSEYLFMTQNGEPLWEFAFWDNFYAYMDQASGTDISKESLTYIIGNAWPLVSKRYRAVLAETWWESFFYSLHLRPWVVPLFKKLSPRMPMGVLSNSPRELGDMKLKQLGLTRYFSEEHILWAYDLGKPKPNAEPFLILCDRLALSPQNTMVIGDNEQTDIFGAKAAGMKYHLYQPGKEAEMLFDVFHS